MALSNLPRVAPSKRKPRHGDTRLFETPASSPHSAQGPPGKSVPSADQTIEYIHPSKLKPHPANARRHPKKQIRQIANSITSLGFRGAIIVNAENTILAGHGRCEAAVLLGLQRVPCIRAVGLTEAEELAYLLGDNRIAETSVWDLPVLANNFEVLLHELPLLQTPLDIDITGFQMGEVDAALHYNKGSAAEPEEGFSYKSADAQSISQRGDLWCLGKHRLLCGDACDAVDVATLSAGYKAEMVLADSPFNVKVQGHVGGRGKRKHAEFRFASGEMSDSEFREFLRRAIGLLSEACKPGGMLYLFIDWRHVEVMCEVGRTLGLGLRNIIVWNKTTPGQGSFYRSAHEFVVLFQKPGDKPVNNVQLGRFGRSRSNVWTYAPPNKFARSGNAAAEHPTPKPIGMCAEAILDATNRKGIVLDTFLGSGTTLLAAEKVGRICHGMELEPRYCDLAIERWQEFTGQDAILTSSGLTYGEVAAERTVGKR
jgi:DNA modification methylase